MYKMILLFLAALMFGLDSCSENPIQPIVDPSEPKADAGANQTINVGSYFIFDASKSSKGNGNKLSITWTQDNSNPLQLNLFSDSVFYVAATIEGTYKFSLVVNNGIKNSNPSKLTITVKPKQNSLFSDPVLEATVRIALNKQEGDWADADLMKIDSLKVSASVQNTNKKVSDLDGIEKCLNLKQLLVSLQSISDISPLVSLINLERLDIDQNNLITDGSPLSNLTKLKYLNISENKINNISVLKKLINLEYINVLWNPIADISVVSNFKMLREFMGTNLPITDLSVFSMCTNLEGIFLDFSKINDISAIKNLIKLQRLELSDNEITDISLLSNLKNLSLLWLGNNKIEDISVLQGLENLGSIILNNNKISDIAPLVNNKGLVAGTQIGLTGNPLNDKSINEYVPQLVNRGIIVYWQ